MWSSVDPLEWLAETLELRVPLCPRAWHKPAMVPTFPPALTTARHALLLCSLIALAACRHDPPQAPLDDRAAVAAPSASTSPASASPASASASGPAIPVTDAEGLVRTLAAATHATTPRDRAAMLMAGCSEIPTCAGECRAALQKASSNLSSTVEKQQALEGCFADFQRDHRAAGLTAEDWIERRLAAYADRAIAANVLAGENAKLLVTLRGELRAK